MAEVLFRDECYAIVGACFAVYNKLGHCFTEPVCHECLAIEFEHLSIPFLSQPPLTLQYRGRTLQHTFAPDFICYERIILEIKAVEALNDKHRAQTINYLHAAGCDLGLLVNFGSHPKLQWERFLHSRLRRGVNDGDAVGDYTLREEPPTPPSPNIRFIRVIRRPKISVP